mmetsp:Transcript_814/g.2316  ORF Transcript_814/g.2316 Transcript_814/m.2316 type:complete len:91 (-) Transcript_814:938-1210(-)
MARSGAPTSFERAGDKTCEQRHTTCLHTNLNSASEEVEENRISYISGFAERSKSDTMGTDVSLVCPPLATSLIKEGLISAIGGLDRWPSP